MTDVPYVSFRLNKLIRDKAPERFGKKGHTVHYRKISGNDLEDALLQKLLEEADEVKNAKTRQDRTEELGDLLEVIDALVQFWDLSREEIDAAKKIKKNELGGFEGGFFGTHCDIPTHDEAYVAALRAQPHKYPEIK
ncbi:MAG: hypothetical protein C0514_01305 [Candidatus Puniceispirillum sp.]|nr:hypothetical protein [Candidatus Puniceispirillum sp.]